MMHKRKRQPVFDNYSEHIGYLETSGAFHGVVVLDADGYEIARTPSIFAGRRYLLNAAYNNKNYLLKWGGRR